MKFNKKSWYYFVLLLLTPSLSFASDESTIGTIASSITNSLAAVSELIIAVSVLAGLGFGVASMFKFKQHKDNPTQVPLGQPMAFLAIAIFLIWLPFILKAGGQTMGAKANGGTGKISGGTPEWLRGSTFIS